MLAAKGQAEQYAKALPVSEGWPPFLVVVDVGYSIELYSDFTHSGKTYIPFPDARSHRILLSDLTKPKYQERLRLVWLNPMSLDPSRRSARVTRDVAEQLARLAKSLEDSGHAPEVVANFLMRSIFAHRASLPDRRNVRQSHRHRPGAERERAWLAEEASARWT
jgi:hypothetical protein